MGVCSLCVIQHFLFSDAIYYYTAVECSHSFDGLHLYRACDTLTGRMLSIMGECEILCKNPNRDPVKFPVTEYRDVILYLVGKTLLCVFRNTYGGGGIWEEEVRALHGSYYNYSVVTEKRLCCYARDCHQMSHLAPI